MNGLQSAKEISFVFFEQGEVAAIFTLWKLTTHLLVATYLDNLYDDDDSESGNGWISWFCDLEGHEFFVEVDEECIRDNFNLHGLREKIHLFK